MNQDANTTNSRTPLDSWLFNSRVVRGDLAERCGRTKQWLSIQVGAAFVSPENRILIINGLEDLGHVVTEGEVFGQ